MSDRGGARLRVIASTDEGKKQLKEFTNMCKSTEETFSLNPLYPVPKIFTADSREWRSEYWGSRYDAFESKILIDRESKFEVEFGVINGIHDEWLKKVSKDFPELYFYNKYYIGPWEGENLFEVQNGIFIDHFYHHSIPSEITSNKFSDYLPFAQLTPKDKNGKAHPFTFTVIRSTTILVEIKDRITKSRCSKFIDRYFYTGLLFTSINNYCNNKNIDVPINLDEWENGDPIMEYSIVIHGKTIDEAIEESLKLIDSFHRPILEAIEKIKNILISEFGWASSRFEPDI